MNAQPARAPSTVETVLAISMMRALAIFRWVTLGGAVVGLILSRAALVEPVAAVVLLGAATALTAHLFVVGRRQPAILLDWPLLATEVVLGLVLLVGDGLVFSDERAQSLPWAWPAAGIAAVGIAAAGRGSWSDGNRIGRLGDHAGLVVAILVATVSLLSEVILLDRFVGADQLGALFSKIGLWLLVGLLVGPLMRRLLRAERLISVARAREELARDQENSLRTHLSDARLIGAAAAPSGQKGEAAVVAAEAGPAGIDTAGGLDATLRRVAAEGERRHRFKAQVLVAPDCPPLGASTIGAVAGAVAEAITNAAKHGSADRVTIFAEPEEGGGDSGWAEGGAVFVSVHDNGSGFEVDGTREGIGMSRSIKGRIADQGGRVEITSRPGKGTEVKIWVKVDDRGR